MRNYQKRIVWIIGGTCITVICIAIFGIWHAWPYASLVATSVVAFANWRKEINASKMNKSKSDKDGSERTQVNSGSGSINTVGQSGGTNTLINK